MNEDLLLTLLLLGTSLASILLALVGIYLYKDRFNLLRELDQAEQQLLSRQEEIHKQRQQLEENQGAYQELDRTLKVLEKQRARMEDQVSSLQDQLAQQRRQGELLRQKMGEHPHTQRQVYRVVAIGLPRTGKTSLILKWANPLWELKDVQGTSFDQFTRTVSSVRSGSTSQGAETITDHVFEIFDYGGEHIVDAQEALVMNDVHGLLFVVDLAGEGGSSVDPARIATHLEEFQPKVLKYFFKSPRITKSCRTVVVFVNKSDLIAGTPAEVEAIARAHFRPLIENLKRFVDNVEIEVMVGSAHSGHNTHRLMAHFIRKLLPTTAYDAQLLQKQVGDGYNSPEAVA